MRIPLTTGAYTSRSIIASAQRSINLYSEHNPTDAAAPVAQYVCPGTDLKLTGTGSPARCTYRASNGSLYMAIGSAVYYIDSSFNRTMLGSITYGTTPVSMADNGLAIIIVDGSSNGWAINLTGNAFAQIPTTFGGPFYGGTTAAYLDTFFLLNVPNTNQWYISLSESTFEMLTSVYGAIQAGTIVGGSGYTNGTYTLISLTGGSGAGAVATITVAGTSVTSVVLTNEGAGYVLGDTLSATGIGPGTNFAFQVTQIGGAFDPLDIATKNGYPDAITGLITMHREIWLIGQLTTEIWYDAGAADFTFQAMPGAFIQHGCNAPYTICTQDLSVYWLSLDPQGRAIFMRGAAYQAQRISTHAIENEWMTYPTTTDAVAYVYQQDGHTFVVVNFPSGNATWVYDQATELWHQRCWTDNNGNLNRHRGQCGASAYQMNLIGDWQNGNLYAFDLDTFTDNIDNNGLNPDGSYPMSFIRSFPHLVEDGKRVSYERFSADFQAGTDTGGIDGTSSAIGAILSGSVSGGSGYTNGTYTNTALVAGSGVNATGTIVVSGNAVTSVTVVDPGQKYVDGDILTSLLIGAGTGFKYTVTSISKQPTISLRWSDDRGKSYGNKVEQSMGAAGQYLVQPQWRRTGLARDRVFELSWSTPTLTALQGAWVDVTPAGT